MKEKIGIFGGTFAPVHNGHLHAAAAFYREMNLDRLYLMPANIPPHKQIDVSDNPADRLAMLRFAAETMDGHVTVSDYEIRKSGKSYTYDTLTHFASPDRELFFLCGTDMFLTLEDWYRGRELFGLAIIVCSVREDDEESREQVIKMQERYREIYGADTRRLSVAPLPMSSSAIRARIAAGEAIDDYVPTKVGAYIAAHHLYERKGTTNGAF